jgi:tetratricopeptide (TPR) repeat protein
MNLKQGSMNRDAFPMTALKSPRACGGLTAVGAGLLGLGFGFAAAAAGPARLDLAPLQSLITNGQPAQALQQLAAALERDPENARLLYNHAVAAYAAERYDEALLSLDRAETLGNAALVRRVKFQQGNTEYRVGLAARKANLEETIARWRDAIRHYADVLKESDDAETAANFDFVRQQLLRLLLDEAAKNLAEALKPALTLGQKLEQLRNGFEKFQQAKELVPESQEAQQGEQNARDQLANALAKEGTRKSLTTRMVNPGRFEAPIPRLDYKEIEEGVAMLEDAQQLKPEAQDIAAMMEQAKDRLADALTQHAQNLIQMEPNMPWPKERLAVLRMAKEKAQEALDKRPQHERAQQTLDEANRRLAKLMEELADHLAQQAEVSNLEQETQQLTQALDFYQQSQELQPENKNIPPKAQRTQQKLEQALDKLADKLMQDQGDKESMEAKAARLEGAEQALNQLQGLNPSEQTGKKADQVGQQLEGLRGELAQKASQEGKSQPQPGPGQQQLAQQMQNAGVPMDAPPKVNTPGAKGQYQSSAMNKGQDY